MPVKNTLAKATRIWQTVLKNEKLRELDPSLFLFCTTFCCIPGTDHFQSVFIVFMHHKRVAATSVYLLYCTASQQFLFVIEKGHREK